MLSIIYASIHEYTLILLYSIAVMELVTLKTVYFMGIK